MRHFLKCPVMDLNEECQRLYEAKDVSQLRDHVIKEVNNGCDRHARIHFMTSGELVREMLVNVHWYRQSAFYDMESHLRDRIFAPTTFGTGQPQILNMIPTTTTTFTNL